MLLAKAKLDTIEVQICKALIDSYINYDDFVSVNMCHENKMRWKRNQISWNFCGLHYINMVDISWKKYKRNGEEAKVDSSKILRLNEKHIEEGLDHKTLQVTTVKYPSCHRKHRDELVDEPKIQKKQNLYTQRNSNQINHGL